MTTPAEILKPICSTDTTRPTIAEPFGIDFEGQRWACATDGHMLVMIAAADFPARERAPDVTAVLKPEPAPTHLASVPLLREWAGPIPPPPLPPSTEKKEVTCEECDGSGESECFNCGQDTDCEECDGTGKVEEEPEPTKIEPHYGALLGGVLNRHFLAHALATLPDDVTEIRIGHGEELSPYILRAPDWIAAIMPVRGIDAKERFDLLEAA